MNREKAKKARIVLNRILEENKQDLDAFRVAAHVGNATFDSSGITFKVELRDINEDGTVETKEREDYKTYARVYDLEQKWLDEVFEFTDGKMYKVIGLMPRSKKYPVLVESVETGKQYKFSDWEVRRAFVAMKPEAPKPKTPPKTPEKEEKKEGASPVDLVNDIIGSING